MYMFQKLTLELKHTQEKLYTPQKKYEKNHQSVA